HGSPKPAESFVSIPQVQERGLHIIESQDFALQEQGKSVSSPSETEHPLFFDHLEKLADTGTKGADAHVIDSAEYIGKDEGPLTSPTIMEEIPSDGRVDRHTEYIAAYPESKLDIDVKDYVYGTVLGQEEPHVIESEEYVLQDKDRPLTSPTATEQPCFTGDETSSEHIATIRETQAVTERGEFTYVPLAEREEPYIIESEEYAPQLEERPISSPTRLEQPDSSEYRLESDAAVTPTHHLLELQAGPEERAAEMEAHVIDSKEYDTSEQRGRMSPSDDVYVEAIPDDERRKPGRLSPEPSLPTLEEEALANVVKMRFSDTIELESPEKQSAQSPSSYPDEQHSIAGDDDWKVFDNKGEVVEEFSSQLTQELIQEANASMRSAESPRKMVKQESCEVTMEPEVDYHADLQEKLDILAEERREKLFSLQEEDQLGVIDETDYEHEADHEQEIDQAASRLVDEVISAAMESHEDAKTQTSTSGSNVYQTATEHSKDDQYETCVTSQDTYDSAQEWTSQESEYTTAASGVTSRLSEAEERQGSVTPLAVLSPVDSDRQFTANQDLIEETVPVIRHFTIDDTARSTPDVPLQVTIEEEEEESEATLPTSPSGVLLAPHVDPGRPVSPIPPKRQAEEDEEYFVFDTYDSAQEWTSQESEYTTAASGVTSRLSEAEERQGSVTPLAVLSPVDSDRQFTANQDLIEETVPVIRHFTIDDTARSTPDVPLQVTIEEEEEESEATLPTSPSGVLLAPHVDPGRPVSPIPPKRQAEEDEEYFVFVERPEEKSTSRGSPEKPHERSAEAESTADSQYSRQLSDISTASYADTVIHHGRTDVEEIAAAFERVSGSPDSLDRLSTKSSPADKRDMASQPSSASPEKPSDESEEKAQSMESPSSGESPKEKTSDNEEGFVICSPIEEAAAVEGELETVEEEPEDVESINGSGNSSVGVPSDTLALVGKYKHVSSDNVSLTSLQEFERLEQMVLNRGEGSLSASEIELYAAGKLRNSGGSGEGSVSSLAEFEKLEQELTANLSPQEEVAMLPEIREESEVEDMSVRDDDEEEHSETEVKTRPIDEEDLRAQTPVASPVDSLDREPIVAALPLLETSTDSLEPSYERVETHTQRDSEASSLAEYEVSLS
ncbi:hypothetical protein OESDEN_06643, partial [Oesophagostomum dentatum]